MAKPSPINPHQKQRSTLLLVLNYTFLFVGTISSSLLSRFYFYHGGTSRWLSTLVQSLGFPLLVPLLLLHPRRPFFSSSSYSFTPRLLSLSLLVGLCLGVNNFLFSWGISFLPVSTSSLLLSSQISFNLLLSVALVRQRLRLTNLNCVVLLTLSSVLLALNSSHDRPTGVTTPQFFLGFSATLGAALLFAVYLPVMQIVLRTVTSYRGVVELQVVMEVAATVFAVAGMAAGGGFREVEKDASAFELGVRVYWLAVAATVVCWQMCFMATAGSVYLTSSLNSGICMTALLPANVVAGVAVFGDSFGGVKAVATALCVWGFSTYLYGEYERGIRGAVAVEEEEKEEEEERVVVEEGHVGNNIGQEKV